MSFKSQKTQAVIFGLLLSLSIGNGRHAQGADPSFACLDEPGPVEVVSGFFGEKKVKLAVTANKKFDARTASFEYPETISHAMISLGERGGSGADNMCWAGGYFTASLSWHDLHISWEESKRGHDDTATDRGDMNNTTSATSYENLMTWTGLHVYNIHDGIRTNNSGNNWTIQHVWLDYIRDDCIENDHIYSGTVYDSLFDGCYTGFSVRPSSSSSGVGQIVTMDQVLLRMEPMPYPYKWDTKSDPTLTVPGYRDIPFGHGSVFKMDAGNEPTFQITNSVFLHEYDAKKVIFPPKDKVIACSNNTIIWLDGSATGPTYLLNDFPGCFTIITDEAEGEAFWKHKVADWHARHPGVGADKKPANPGSYHWPRFAAGGATAPTASITASPMSITDGESSTITWSSSDADSCTGTNFSTGGITSDSTTVAPTTGTTYTVTCSNHTGDVSDSVTVMVAPISTKFSIGDRVEVSTGDGSSLDVGSVPSLRGTLLGSQPAGAQGTIVGGPVSADGFVWWEIDYDNTSDGWSVEDWLAVVSVNTDTKILFTPTDDSTIKTKSPNATFGGHSTLGADGSPHKEFLIKFNVSGVSGRTVTSATLRLFSVDSSDKGGELHSADTNWSEETVTWNTTPAAHAAVLGSFGAVARNRWYEIDLTSHVTGDGAYSFRMTTLSNNGSDYSSKEGVQSPELVVEVQ